MSSDTPAPTSAGDRPARAAVPAALSLGALGVAMIATVLVALRNERGTSPTAAVHRAPGAVVARDVLTGAATSADGWPMPPESGWGSRAQPIRFRFVPSSDQASASAGIEHMLEFLRARTGYAIEGAILRSYGLVVQEIVQGQAEIAFLTTASYARARFATDASQDPDDDVEAILAAVRAGNPAYPGSDLAYRGAIIVRSDSDITAIGELGHGRSIAMGSRTSGASSILPTALLVELGLEPRIQRFEGYPVIVSAVLQGAVDAGCIWWSPPTDELPDNDARITVREANPDVFERTRIIAFTPWLPNEPVVARSALPAPLRHTLARAITLYAASRATTPEGRHELMAIGGVVGFVPARNEDFAGLMEILERAFANDPEGRADFMASSK